MQPNSVAVFIAEIDFAVGGTESYFASLLQSLQDIYPNADFEVITTYMPSQKQNQPEQLRLKLNSLYGTKIQKNFSISRIPYAMNNRWSIIRGARWYKNYTKRFDICFNCTRNLLISSAKKNYAIIHFPVLPYSKWNVFKKFPIFKGIANQLDLEWKKSYDLFLCNSKYTEIWLKNIWNISSKKTDVLYPPIQVLKTALSKKRQILISSRIDSSKSIDVLIRAFYALEVPDLKLVIAGAKLPEHELYYSELQELDKEKKIEWHFNPSRDDLEKLYSESLLFWHAKGYSVDENEHPDLLEHFGMTTVEAMSAGCIPVVINKGGQKEIVDDGSNGFKWNSEKELVEKTRFVLQKCDCVSMRSEAIKKSGQYDFKSFSNHLRKYLSEEVDLSD